MPVTIIIEVTHTENGIELKPEVKTLANGHCAHEMAFATSLINIAMRASECINQSGSAINHYYGENKHVH